MRRLALVAVWVCFVGCGNEARDTAPSPSPAPAPLPPAPLPAPACPVDAEGVAVSEGALTTAAPIRFDLYGPALAPETLGQLDAVARRLVACSDISIEVQVHTDTRRVGAFNARQSQAVAGLVRDRLVSLGVSAERVAACGRGEAAPDPAMEPFADAQNRVLFVRIPAPASAHPCPPAE